MLLTKRKNNETDAHYELKQVAKYLLWKNGYKHVGCELDFCCGMDEADYWKGNRHSIIDCAGIKSNAIINAKRSTETKSMGFEAKASLSDFKNGFCTACEYTYVIAPKGIIPVELLPKNIGLVEVDLDNYTIEVDKRSFSTTGIEYVKKARSRLAPRFKTEKDRQIWNLELLRQIAYRNTIDEIYYYNEIEIKKLKKRK